jgi:hypothetical protein
VLALLVTTSVGHAQQPAGNEVNAAALRASQAANRCVSPTCGDGRWS